MNSERKVLIVDDAAFMRAMLKRIIREAGAYGICEAPDGETALEFYEKERPGLVLLDISMPGMNGIETLKEIRNMDREAFVIMCSAIGQEAMIREAIDNGARDFIVKPFNAEQIREALALAFQNGEPGVSG